MLDTAEFRDCQGNDASNSIQCAHSLIAEMSVMNRLVLIVNNYVTLVYLFFPQSFLPLPLIPSHCLEISFPL